MSDALKTLWESLRTQLASGDSIWDSRMFPDYAPAGADRPLIVYSLIGGGEDNQIHKSDPEYFIDVKCITSGENANLDALTGAGEISDLLNNQGSQDIDDNGDPGVVTGDKNWVITTITQGLRIHQVDNWSENSVAIYHSGHEFRVTMEEL